MGGSVFEIYGKDILYKDKKEGLLSLLFKRNNIYERNSKEMKEELKNLFLQYLSINMPNMNQSSINIMEYINKNENFKCTIKHIKNGNDKVEIEFSGYAGMREISAQTARHWVEIWYSEKRENINDILRKYQFDSDGEIMSSNRYFASADEAGYALCVLDDVGLKEYAPNNIFQTDLFEIDGEYFEEIEEKKFIELMKSINMKYTGNMVKRECMCELCCRKRENK